MTTGNSDTPKAGKIKPNGFPAPAAVANTRGIIVPKTSPEPKAEPGDTTPPPKDLNIGQLLSTALDIMKDSKSPAVLIGAIGALMSLPASEGDSPSDDLPTPKPGNGSDGGYILGMSAAEKRKMRYEKRKEMLAGTEGDARPPEVIAAHDRFELNNDNILRAEASEYVYKVDEFRRGALEELPEPPLGLELIEPEEMGMEMDNFMNDDSGFGAAMFHSDISGENMLVYRGTNNSVTGGADWMTNLGQGAGNETAQYTQAMDLAKDVKAQYGDDFVIVGHSLGGGLGSSGVAVTGNQGYTFNSAGLHPSTATRRGGSSNAQTSDLIETQSVEGEVLTGAQSADTKIALITLSSLGGGWAVEKVAQGFSEAGWLSPAVGNRHSLESVSGGNPVTRHGMSQVIEGIEQQKKEDEAILKRYLAIE